MRHYSLSAILRQFAFVREVPGNRGQRVEAVQRWGGGKPGDSWCCFLATMALDICYQGASPVPRTGSCDVVLTLAREKGWVVTEPAVDDLYLFVRGESDAHHIGAVSELVTAGPVGISGNTSRDGQSSNGDGVYERPIKAPAGSRVVYVRVRG